MCECSELNNTTTILHTTAMAMTAIISYKAAEATISNLKGLNLGNMSPRPSYKQCVSHSVLPDCFPPTKHPV